MQAPSTPVNSKSTHKPSRSRQAKSTPDLAPSVFSPSSCLFPTTPTVSSGSKKRVTPTKSITQQIEEQRLLLHEQTKSEIPKLQQGLANVSALLAGVDKLKKLRLYLVLKESEAKIKKDLDNLVSGQNERDYLLAIESVAAAAQATNNAGEKKSVPLERTHLFEDKPERLSERTQNEGRAASAASKQISLTHSDESVHQNQPLAVCRVSTTEKFAQLLQAQMELEQVEAIPSGFNLPKQVASTTKASTVSLDHFVPQTFQRHKAVETLQDPQWEIRSEHHELCPKCKQPLREGDTEGLVVCERCPTTSVDTWIYPAIDMRAKKPVPKRFPAKKTKPQVKTTQLNLNSTEVKGKARPKPRRAKATRPKRSKVGMNGSANVDDSRVKTRENKRKEALNDDQENQFLLSSVWNQDVWKTFATVQRDAHLAGARGKGLNKNNF